MMKLVLLLTFVLIICLFKNADCYGANTFYATFVLTNAEYGAGAAFNCAVWFTNNGGNFQRMRVDYYALNGTLFQQELFDFVSHDKYQTCGTICKHETYNSAAPSFNTASGFVSMGSCPTPDYTAVLYCASNCLGYQSSPQQAQGVNQIGFNAASPNAPCIIRWTVQTGYNYSNEWHITNYYTSSPYPNGDPSLNSTYNSVTSGVTCPQATCNALIDIALVLDETGSISAAHAYPAVQQFALGVVNAFNGSFGPNATRMGLTYFSGLDTCTNCSDPGTWVNCNSNGCVGDSNYCYNCGGRWDVQVSPPTTNQALLQNIIITHPIQNGHTCLTCGVQQGTNILNASPRPGVPRVMFFFTDGVQNRDCEYLSVVSANARAQGIIIYAIGVASYDVNTLITITGNVSRVYSANSYANLLNVIPSLVSQLCQPLPPFEICNFCSGLCTCATTCMCPASCNDGNVCTQDICNTLPYNPNSIPPGTAGLCLYPSNATNCNDGNACTQDLCDPVKGCQFPPAPRPNGVPPDTLCYSYKCVPPGGAWVKVDNSATACPPSTPCIIQYCNTTSNSCQMINKNLIPTGTPQAYIDAVGNTQVVYGCGAPLVNPGCKNYSCNATGSCVVTSLGQCCANTDCNDNNGCTNDTCTNHVCSNIPIDCYNVLSNGMCSVNTNYLTSNATGYLYYINYGNTGALNTLFPVDANRNPTIGPTRSCDYLACYLGQPSTYSCVSTSSSTYNCVRSAGSCTLGSCSDQICRSIGQSSTWAGGNLEADCGVTINANCNNGGNLCTSSSCNSTWSHSDPVSLRCIPTSNSSSCNPNNVCYSWGCVPATGCSKSLLPVLTNTSCFGY